MKTFEIIYEDQDILVCYKPAGLAVQTKRLGQQDLETKLRNYLAAKKEKPYIGIVHRLDQPVEGLMVFAKNPKAAAELNRQVASREIGKHYLAVGCNDDGRCIPEAGTLTDYLTFDTRSNVGAVSTAADSQAKKAVLDYKVTDRRENRVCFDIHLHTGRHHQIRLQLMNLGFPLAGDSKYGGSPEGQLALCAYRLALVHPTTKKKLEYRIKPENPAFQQFI